MHAILWGTVLLFTVLLIWAVMAVQFTWGSWMFVDVRVCVIAFAALGRLAWQTQV